MENDEVESIAGLDAESANMLSLLGWRTVGDLANATLGELSQVPLLQSLPGRPAEVLSMARAHLAERGR